MITSSNSSYEPSTSSQSGMFSSIAVSLGSHIQDKIKHKIWADQCIDLSVLVSPTTLYTTKYSVSVCSNLNNGLGKLSLEPVHKPKRIESIGQWLSAFNMFVSLYSFLCIVGSCIDEMLREVRGLAYKQGH